jgi:N-acetylmuramoyl-L-alanine amidase
VRTSGARPRRVSRLAAVVATSLLLALPLGGTAAAATQFPCDPTACPSPQQQQAVLTALNQATHVQFQVTTPLPAVWVTIFNGSQTVADGPASVSVNRGVYAVVYTVYQNLRNVFQNVASVVATVYTKALSTITAVYYSVYLHPIPPVTTPPQGVPLGQGVTIGTIPIPGGTIQTGTTVVAGEAVSAVQVSLTGQSLNQAVASLPSDQSTLALQIPASAVPSGGAVLVSLPPDGIAAVAGANKSLAVQTPAGSVTLPPAALQQLASQLQPGQQATVVIASTPPAQLQQITSSLPPDQKANLHTAGAVVDLAVNITDANGQTVGSYEPSGNAQVNLTLPFDASSVSGVEALKLGVYVFDASTNQWDYVGGSTNLQAGTVSVGTGYLSTYAVLADDQTFADIQGYWAQTDIEIMVAHHVVNGESATSFDPAGSVTRAQFAAMVARALGLTIPAAAATSFTDVPAGAWYAGTVAAAAGAGIVKGYPDGSFRPDAPITRQEMAVMIDRAMAAANQPTTVLPQQVAALLAPYADAGQVADWAKPALAADVEQHIINGMTPTTLAPAATTTRAQAAVMLRRLLGYLGTL